MLKAENAVLLVIDVQGKLAEIVENSAGTRANVVRLIRGADLLEVPVVATEQAPEKLGPTAQDISEALGDRPRPAKTTFSCWSDEGIRSALRETGRDQIIVCGIETHVCVWQTVRDLLDEGWAVQVVGDAVSSRSRENREAALARMASAGAEVTTTEMALFEMQEHCRGDRFRALSKLVK